MPFLRGVGWVCESWVIMGCVSVWRAECKKMKLAGCGELMAHKPKNYELNEREDGVDDETC